MQRTYNIDQRKLDKHPMNIIKKYIRAKSIENSLFAKVFKDVIQKIELYLKSIAS